MEKKVKILHICSYWYSTNLYKNLMDQLNENNVEIKVYAPTKINNKYNGNEKYLIQEKCFREIDRFFFHYKYNKAHKKLFKNVNVKEYDLIHAHSLFSNGYLAYRVFKEFNIPYIVAVRSTDMNVFFKYCFWLRKLGVEILENASKIILISNSYKERIVESWVPKEKRENIEKKCVVIPNGIDDYYIENKKEPKKINNHTLNLVYTGRIDRRKNLIATIKCCEKILKYKYDVKLTVIGKIFSKKYKKIIKKYDFIDYVGPKTKEEIIKIYKKMNIFVMPSKHETFGLAYVEAMSQGLPVIYTRNEGFDKFFGDGEVGYPIKYNNYMEMAEKIELIIENYETISKNCIEKFSIFNWSDITQKYIEIYKKIIK